MSEGTRYWMMRLGSIAGILGSLGAAIGNILHPITPRDDPVGVAQVIAESGVWTEIHLVIVLGTLLMLGGIVAIRLIGLVPSKLRRRRYRQVLGRMPGSANPRGRAIARVVGTARTRRCREPR
jgi:hypothetical protein